MKHSENSKMRAVFWVMLGIFACLPFAPAMAGHYSDGIWIPDGVCMDCDSTPPSNNNNSGGYTGPSQGELRKKQERAARNARYDAIHKQSAAAWERGDYREALRLFREKQALRDGPNVREGIAWLEKAIADQASNELGDKYNQQANSAQNNGDSKLALKLYKLALATYPNPTSEYRQWVADYEKRVQREAKELDERLKREAEAAERERRHRPKVERLREEATALLDANPAEALAKLDASLKLLPGDTKATMDWWLAQASLALLEARYDAAFEALEKSKGHGLDAGEIARWQGRIKDERARQGAEVQNAFADLRQRLAATPVGTEPGAQLKSVEQHGRQAKAQANDASKRMAGEGFDTLGTDQGTLVYPDKNHHHPPPSALDKQVPPGTEKDPQIAKMQTWYRSLEMQKAEKEQKIAEFKEQQKTSKDPLLATKIATLANDVKRLKEDQGMATKTVKKRVLDMGLAWDEIPSPEPAATAEAVKEPAPESAKLDFIQN